MVLEGLTFGGSAGLDNAFIGSAARLEFDATDVSHGSSPLRIIETIEWVLPRCLPPGIRSINSYRIFAVSR